MVWKKQGGSVCQAVTAASGFSSDKYKQQGEREREREPGRGLAVDSCPDEARPSPDGASTLSSAAASLGLLPGRH